MNRVSFPYFNSKILLFGEYSLMVGSKALSMPSDKFQGGLKFAEADTLQGEQIQSNHELKKYALALKTMQDNNLLDVQFDFGKLFNDLDSGLFFNSNIPQGYGLGSSGALVAAIYNEYGLDIKRRTEQFSDNEISALKSSFSKMESFFHGKSSGLDPLICFLQKPILVTDTNNVATVDIPESKKESDTVLFLLDTNISGETQPLVNYFIKQNSKKQYLNKITNELIPLNDMCIRAFLDADIATLSQGMKQLSAFTLNNFAPMVPEKIKPIWKGGLYNNDYSLKLCGSGGGGMMLGFTTDFKKTQSQISDFKLEMVYRF